MSIVVRFAPSPTGFLHIGGARTALFNWLFARHNNGKFLLRIEDTDRERSTQEAIDAIFESLKWLELDWDEDVVFQFARSPRHAEVAHKLVESGSAYYCYCSSLELEKMRSEAIASGAPPRYNGKCRHLALENCPINVNPVVRFKAPDTGTVVIDDLVQGRVEIANAQLDDMVLLRSDGTPTYMLSVVVDDHDMGITHIIRGDDHLTNAFRQYNLYKACGWEVPKFAHIPLIHGSDGAKLSKRHGALGTEQYREMGFLPDAMRNYLVRLGWAHGNEEIMSTKQAVEWFDIANVGRSPARFDIVKLTNINGYYIRNTENEKLVELIKPIIYKLVGNIDISSEKFKAGKDNILKGMNGLKERAKTLQELAENSLFYIIAPQFCSSNEVHTLASKFPQISLEKLLSNIENFILIVKNLEEFSEKNLEIKIREYCTKIDVKLGDFLHPIRIALTGKNTSPSLFEVVFVLGKAETCKRVQAYANFFDSL